MSSKTQSIQTIVATAMLTVVSGAAGQVTFTNATTSSGLVSQHAPDSVCMGNDYWMTGGCAVGDFNNDNWPDLYWVGGGLTPDKLFLNSGDGTFTEQAAAWGLGTHSGVGASVADFNNDGRLDIFVTSYGEPGTAGSPGKHRLYRNDGAGFTDVAVAAGVNQASPDRPAGFGSAWGDYDNDGDLDLFVCTWKIPSISPAPGNILFRNNGDSTFTNVTQSAIGAVLDEISGFQPRFIDLDDDTYPELIIAADFGTSHYLKNNADGTFTDLTASSGTGLDTNGMGQTIGDFNNDGLFDWYVTSIHLEGGGTHATGNMLYMATATHQYTETSQAAGCNDGGFGWGTIAVDLDHDTLVDIVEVNGNVDPEQAYLFYNNGDDTFSEIAVASGIDHTDDGRGLAWLDADRDGDLDIVICTNFGALEYYRNDTAPIGSWLHITLDTSGSATLPPNGFGAKVTATIGGQSYIRSMDGHPSYVSTSELIVHFGLGIASVVDELRVQWPDGRITVLKNVAVNQILTIDDSAVIPQCTGDVTGDGAVNVFDLLALLSAWGLNPGHNADFDDNNSVDVFDLLDLLNAWGDC